MKRKLLMFVFCLVGLCAWADVTDHIEISAASSPNPGGSEVKLTVSLVGSTKYTAYWFDVYLPEGVSLVQKSGKNASISAKATKESAFYPSTYDEEEETYSYTHTLTTSYGVVSDRVLRVSCNSNINEKFLANSGELFTFYVKASSYCKPGQRTIDIKGFGLKEAAGIDAVYPADHTATINVSTSATASINVNAANKWSTCILPFDAAVPEGVKVYECDGHNSEKYLTLQSVNQISAYTPYILYSENGYSGTLSGTVDAAEYPESGIVTKGYLKGTVVTSSVGEGNYILQNKGSGAMFYLINNGDSFSVPAGKCWISIPNNESKARFLGLNNIDEASSISDIEPTVNEQTIYTLQGTRVSKMQSGHIYIQNGVKILSK